MRSSTTSILNTAILFDIHGTTCMKEEDQRPVNPKLTIIVPLYAQKEEWQRNSSASWHAIHSGVIDIALLFTESPAHKLHGSWIF